MNTLSSRFLVAAVLAGLLSCSAGEESSPIGPAGGGGADAAAGAAGGSAAGNAGAAGEGEGGEAGEGGEGGEGGEAGAAGQSGQGGGGLGGEGGGSGCDEHWAHDVCSLGPDASAAAEVKGGALVLTETSAPFLCGTAQWPPYALKVFQSGLSGDFTVSFDFEGFTSSGYGVGVHAYVVETGNDDEAASASILDTGSGTNLKATIIHEGKKQEDVEGTSTKAGKLTIQRVGGFLTVTASGGGDSKNLTSAFSSNPLIVGIALQGRYEPADPPQASSVSIPAFHVTGGGGKVVADEFNCNSIQ